MSPQYTEWAAPPALSCYMHPNPWDIVTQLLPHYGTRRSDPVSVCPKATASPAFLQVCCPGYFPAFPLGVPLFLPGSHQQYNHYKLHPSSGWRKGFISIFTNVGINAIFPLKITYSMVPVDSTGLFGLHWDTESIMTEGEEIYEYRNDYPDYYRRRFRSAFYSIYCGILIWYHRL